MTVDDLHADSLVNTTCFKVHIKCLKTDPFCMGCDIYMWALLRAWCVPSVPSAAAWLFVALLRILSLLLMTVTFLLGNSCHP